MGFHSKPAARLVTLTTGHVFRSYGHAFTLGPLAWERNAGRPCLPPLVVRKNAVIVSYFESCMRRALSELKNLVYFAPGSAMPSGPLPLLVAFGCLEKMPVVSIVSYYASYLTTK